MGYVKNTTKSNNTKKTYEMHCGLSLHFPHYTTASVVREFSGISNIEFRGRFRGNFVMMTIIQFLHPLHFLEHNHIAIF